MHPAFSVIFFTVSSGIGYGLLALMGGLVAFGLLPADRWLGALGLGLGFASISAGLLSSTFHLGRPERAWRAFSQWRTSWLSREGVAAVVTFAPVLVLAYGWVLGRGGTALLRAAGVLTAIGAVATVYCTAMIYQSLKTIHQWHNSWTLPNYLLLGLGGGATLLTAVTGVLGLDTGLAAKIAAVSLAAAWAVKRAYWRSIDTTSHPST
ncbi:MAG: DmsC/YnfH family molybdoenzyme membrane anchor subunit, partial [Rhodospirillaceae bacterium]